MLAQHLVALVVRPLRKAQGQVALRNVPALVGEQVQEGPEAPPDAHLQRERQKLQQP